MVRYLGPKHRMCRRLGIPLCGSEKCPVRRGRGKPGQHGHKRAGRPSDYARQLIEKQKVKHLYGIVERQFRRYFDEARSVKGETGKILLQKLERRLDNVVYRLGFARSRAQARQLVRHGKIEVNGKKVTIPSFEVKVGDEVKFVGKVEDLPPRETVIVPRWLSLDDKEKTTGRVKDLPEREDIDQDINETLIVEVYSRG